MTFVGLYIHPVPSFLASSCSNPFPTFPHLCSQVRPSAIPWTYSQIYVFISLARFCPWNIPFTSFLEFDLLGHSQDQKCPRQCDIIYKTLSSTDMLGYLHSHPGVLPSKFIRPILSCISSYLFSQLNRKLLWTGPLSLSLSLLSCICMCVYVITFYCGCKVWHFFTPCLISIMMLDILCLVSIILARFYINLT